MRIKEMADKFPKMGTGTYCNDCGTKAPHVRFETLNAKHVSRSTCKNCGSYDLELKKEERSEDGEEIVAVKIEPKNENKKKCAYCKCKLRANNKNKNNLCNPCEDALKGDFEIKFPHASDKGFKKFLKERVFLRNQE